MEQKKYPNDSEIKPKWPIFHIGILISSTVLIWGVLYYQYYFEDRFPPWQSIMSIFGLYIDIIGVLFASLKTPIFGSFHDGGELEFKREKADNKTFRKGMLLIAFGFICQAISTLFKNA